jgi:hypothetical protein
MTHIIGITTLKIEFRNMLNCLSQIRQQINKVLEKVSDFFYYDLWYWGIRDKYLTVRGYVRTNFNRHFLRLVWTALSGRPWDFDYLYYLEKAKLQEMLAYQEKHNLICEEQREQIIRTLRLAIRMLDIINNDHNYYHFDGDVKFDPISGSTLSRVNMDDIRYYCDVNVNLRNMNRFVREKDTYQFYEKHPHEVYILKARYLYHKIRFYYTELWWE